MIIRHCATSIDTVFLDRDGTIIVDKHYLCDPAAVEFEINAVAGLRRMMDMNLRLVIVTNQSGVAKGMFGLDAVHRVHAAIADELARADVEIAGWYICPHDSPDACPCRKPAPGLLFQARDELSLDLSRSIVIGDKVSDTRLARSTGAEAILVETGKGAECRDQARDEGALIARDLLDAARMIAELIDPQGVLHA